jgi:hypothetical protein
MQPPEQHVLLFRQLVRFLLHYRLRFRHRYRHRFRLRFLSRGEEFGVETFVVRAELSDFTLVVVQSFGNVGGGFLRNGGRFGGFDHDDGGSDVGSFVRNCDTDFYRSFRHMRLGSGRDQA